MRGTWTPPPDSPDAPFPSPYGVIGVPARCVGPGCPVLALVAVRRDAQHNLPWVCPEGHRNPAILWPTRREMADRIAALRGGQRGP